jgi:hypothetical protein
MRAVIELEKLGYQFHLAVEDGVVVGLVYRHPGELPPADVVEPHLAALKAGKWAAVDFLQQRYVQQWVEAMERWEADDDPGQDSRHLRELADLAIAGGLPFYDCFDDFRNTGEAGWNQFVDSYSPDEEVMPLQAEQTRPLPWT